MNGQTLQALVRGLSFGSRQHGINSIVEHAGKMAANTVNRHATQQGAVMRSQNILLGFKASVFSTPSTTRGTPNCTFNADANTGHAFGIFMACIGTLRASRYGAG